LAVEWVVQSVVRLAVQMADMSVGCLGMKLAEQLVVMRVMLWVEQTAEMSVGS
jgi:hypothetical protein